MKKSFLGGCVLALALAVMPAVAHAEDFDNPPIISGSKLLEKGRYRSSCNFNDTLANYRRILRSANPGQFRWHTIVQQNNIKAKFLENTRKKSTWAGLNIYEYNGETRIFIVPR